MEIFVLSNQVHEVAIIYVLAQLDAAEVLAEILEIHPE
jgi:hypothetical protein